MNNIKLDKSVVELAKIKKWLNANCGKRWTANNYKNQPIDWRKIHHLRNSKELVNNMSTTTYITFTKREDMMEFLELWPSDVLLCA
jgi:hypothetical protein